MARLLPRDRFRSCRIVLDEDPLEWYFKPLLGRLYHRRIDRAMGLLDPGGRVLEIGCGSGTSFLELKERFPRVHGIDRHAYCGDIRRLYAGEGCTVEISRGDVLRLPYASEGFDAVVAISILEHLRPVDQPRVMSEVRRVLRPGGLFVIGVPGLNWLMTTAFRVFGYDIRSHHLSAPRQVLGAARAEFSIERTLRQPPLAPHWALTYMWIRARKPAPTLAAFPGAR